MAQSKGKRRQQQPPPDPDDPDEGGDDGVLFSDEQRVEITNLVNAAVSGQLQRKLPNAIKAGIDGAIAPVLERLDTMGGRRRGADDPDEDDDADDGSPAPRKGKGGAAARTKDPEVDNMRKRLAQLEERDKTRETEARNGKRDGALREHLTKLGVDPNRIRGAIAVLRDATKYDEKAGEWSYVAKRDGFDEDLDLDAGVAEWAKTDEGKSYLAAPDTGGGSPRRMPQLRTGGGVIGGGGGSGGGQAQRGDAKAAKAQAKQDAMANLGKAMDSLAGGNVPLG